MTAQRIIESRIVNEPFSKALPHLKTICQQNGLKLNNLRDFAKAFRLYYISQIRN